ncbi:LysE family translocator [Agrobacterium vitis]|uniref:LysE family translocator n=1 Tax=Rhizobium/Agrobacterium group TaxID=227290 RepID=UPI0008FAFB0A|nr:MULTISPECIES: LysE family translocator [Rhizobium/Agrobacterium group]MCF1435116.1 LysE family translocator [Allorhizobium ampelinum]MUO90523.1 LysE family translocator [Agrobacterium vitis]MUZ52945.1 LysE family translocator [Agrobacterium vitis]MUZ91164.1 LysE family translocator [Agrobacterium vitis]MVA40393.1 LysE family translocator [Agrobacterium vitis]
MDLHSMLTFALAFLVFAASPGPDNVTIMARTLSHGPASGLAYGLGTVTGILIYLTLAFFGLSVLAQDMGWLMELLRYGGAVYLIWMGVRLWMAKPVLPQMVPMERRGALFPVYLTGFALNLGNPKMPLFYLALLPNFVPASFNASALIDIIAIILVVETVVIGGHVFLAGRARRLLKTPRSVALINRTTGGFLGAAGVAILASGRGN